MNRRFVMLLLVASLVEGCALQPEATTDPVPEQKSVEAKRTDPGRMLNYYAYITKLQGDRLEREYSFVKKAYKTGRNEYNHMQLIMLLASPRATFRNTELAHVMVKKWLKEDDYRHSRLRPLAMLYDNYLSEIRRQDALINQATKKLRQNDKRLRQANERSAQQALEIKASQQRSDELQQKLDALLEMEKSLIEREQITSPDKP